MEADEKLEHQLRSLGDHLEVVKTIFELEGIFKLKKNI